MKMIRKAISVLCAALMILGGLCGCQLADPKAGEEAMPDRLIGVYITTEGLNLYDMDTLIEDNIGTIMNGGTLDLTKENSQKLFATVKDVDIDGHKTIEYEFEGIEGIALILREVAVSSNQTESYSEVIAGPEVTYTLTCGDTKSIEGTIYLLADNEIIVYANPVYQTSDGQVYLVPAIGCFVSFFPLATTTSENIKRTVGDDTQQQSMTVTVNYQPRTKCIKTVVKQFDNDDELLTVTQIEHDNIPEYITRAYGTAYIIVEYYGFCESYEDNFKREFLEDGAEYFYCYVLGDKGIFTSEHVEIK